MGLAIYGEGEQPLLDLCRGVSPKDIRNLIYRDGSAIRVNPARDYVTNPDDLPFPRFASLDLDRYPFFRINHGVATVTLRGCPFSCTFCETKNVLGKKFRPRSPEHVLSELQYWSSRGVRGVVFMDDNFTLIRKRVAELCDLIVENGLDHIRYSVKPPWRHRGDWTCWTNT